MIPALIVDDEIPARNELKRFLQEERDFQIIAEASDGAAALKAIRDLKPRVVFLDIHMPQKNGLEVAAEIIQLKEPPAVVFVTAYDQYAIQAFEVNAIDYLLKPFEEERFKKTCHRVRQVLSNPGEIKGKLEALTGYLQKKPLKILGHKRNSKEKIFIHEKDVLYFQVKLTELSAHMINGEELLINSNLKSLIEMIDSDKFHQTHRSYIVNLDYIEKVSPLFAGNFNLTLKDPNKTFLPLSRRYAKKLKQYLKW